MSEKELAELDCAVAKAEGHRPWFRDDGRPPEIQNAPMDWREYSPTRDGAEAMRLLEKYRLVLRPCPYGTAWSASLDEPTTWSHRDGPTPAIAICRAVVALHAARSAVPTDDKPQGEA